MIPRTTIDAIREKVDIVELVESRGITLKRTGARYVGLCPVHSERTPSFNVNSQSQTFHCFGCGIGGDAIAFLIEVESYNFSGAVEVLGDMVGIEVVDSAGEDPDYLRKKDYLRTLSSASWFYRQKFADLAPNHPAKADLENNRNYLHVEGRETWLEDFGMGYAPGTGDALCHFLQSQGYTKEQILDSGLAFENETSGRLRDRFRDRLLWEIRDIKGRPIGYSGRRMSDDDKKGGPKYLNSPETILYKKSKILYGFDLARKKMAETKVCFVTEGAADVMAVSATGYTNTVASCGTGFGEEHAAIIRRVIDDFDAKDNGKIVFVFDGDEAGMKAAAKTFNFKPSIKDRSYVASLDGLDPVDFRVQFGDAALRERLDNPLPITEFMLRRIASKYDMTEIESRSGFTREAMELISYIDEPDIFEAYKRKIATMSGVSMGNLRGERKPEHEEQPSYGHLPPPDPAEGYYSDPYDENPFAGTDAEPQRPRNSSLDRTCRLLVAAMFQYPNQTFQVLRTRFNVTDIFEDQKLKQFLVEGMNKAGFTAVRNEPTRLTTSDFTDSEKSVEFFHMTLDTEEERAEHYVLRLVKNLEELSARAESENLRAAVATQQISEEDALRILLEKKRKKK